MLAAGLLCVLVGSSLHSLTCQPRADTGGAWGGDGRGSLRPASMQRWLKWVSFSGSVLLGLEKSGSLERERWEGWREVMEASRRSWCYCLFFKVEFWLLTWAAPASFLSQLCKSVFLNSSGIIAFRAPPSTTDKRAEHRSCYLKWSLVEKETVGDWRALVEAVLSASRSANLPAGVLLENRNTNAWHLQRCSGSVWLAGSWMRAGHARARCAGERCRGGCSPSCCCGSPCGLQ